MRTRSGQKEQNIWQAAVREFARHGYHQAKISRIAEGAGVATGSVYLYFKNKKQLLEKILADVWQNLAQEMEALVTRKDLNAVEKLEGMVDLVIDMFTDNPSLAIVVVNEHSQTRIAQPYYERFLALGRQVLEEGIATGLLNPHLQVDVTSQFIFGGVRHLIHLWAQSPRQYPLNKIRREVKLLLKRGILTEVQ
ncbi:MAG: TetR/AcrR family transcriptional regulator [Calditrichaeota bacterium]|nr:MAG: TetR/AcrR family transcriptional regulator [Calditrichota bacterium]